MCPVIAFLNTNLQILYKAPISGLPVRKRDNTPPSGDTRQVRPRHESLPNVPLHAWLHVEAIPNDMDLLGKGFLYTCKYH